MRFTLVAALALALLTACRPTRGNQSLSSHPDCYPVDSAWAAAVAVTDAATGAPVSDALVSNGGGLGEIQSTDSGGWACLRTLVAAAETLQVERSGYEPATVVLAGMPGRVVRRTLTFRRVPDPCCELRGRWRITFALEETGEGNPVPTARSVSGEVALGPRVLPPQQGDLLDSLVRVVRGLHEVDFTPFFGGPVFWSGSTTVVGGGPDLLREVMGRIPAGDRVEIIFIPRMSHGSLSLDGRIRSDTITGRWVQNAYSSGARGRFTMTRLGPADTTAWPEPPPAAGSAGPRDAALPPSTTSPAGRIPGGQWRPELAMAPDGRLWLARDGLFVADSLFGAWRRVLGGPADPVLDDELRIGLRMAFVGDRIALIGLEQRYPMDRAPVLYRTDDAGVTWSAVTPPGVTAVEGLSAVGGSIWMVATLGDGSIGLLGSDDAGRSWRALGAPRMGGDARSIGLHRVSDSSAYLYAHTEGTLPSLWRTSDGARHWLPLPAPHDQQLLQLDEWDSRIEEIATVGSWILVREHGRVFASPTERIAWRLLADVNHVASELGGAHVFVLRDSLRPALLDANLQVVWTGSRALPIADPSDVEQVLVRNGVGLVSETKGAVHEIRAGSIRSAPPGDK